MPQAPSLPPEAQASASASAGLNPVNFLIAAADMHANGSLSAPVPTGKDLLPPSQKAARKVRSQHLRVLR